MMEFEGIHLMTKRSMTGLLAATLCFQLLGAVDTEKRPDGLQILSADYIGAWKEFYPTQALANGDQDAAARFETLSSKRIEMWLRINRETLARLDELGPPADFSDRVDRKILRRTLRMEMNRWSETCGEGRRPAWVTGIISQALTHVLVRRQFSQAERRRAMIQRLRGILRMCREARSILCAGSTDETHRSISGLRRAARFFRDGLPAWSEGGTGNPGIDLPAPLCKETAAAVDALADYMEDHLLPRCRATAFMGREAYDRSLRLYTGLDISSGQLASRAREEIRRVRHRILALARGYVAGKYPDKPLPEDADKLVTVAMTDMEANRESNQEDFLQRFLGLIDRAEAFVVHKKLAPVPSQRTLVTALSPPHFAGAAVGGVYPAGPFDPSADTLFYLPTVSDRADPSTRDGFYRSFNNHFNTMIITHEIVPGHYLQLKMAAAHPRPVRALFGGDLFAEGWASLCEEITLDHGWDGNHPLTRLAHLRKRLENAVRAYVSVRVHCDGWEKNRVTDFAVNTGWLPPQFALNLWQRVMTSPLQLTSYFLGYTAFADAYRAEQVRRGDSFSVMNFSRRVLAAGSVPIDLLPDLLHPGDDGLHDNPSDMNTHDR